MEGGGRKGVWATPLAQYKMEGGGRKGVWATRDYGPLGETVNKVSHPDLPESARAEYDASRSRISSATMASGVQ